MSRLTVTRTRHFRLCATCGGEGGRTVNPGPQPFGRPDPQQDVDVECVDCDGSGVRLVWVDPLLEMHRTRRSMRIGMPLAGSLYRIARAQATGRSYGFELLEAKRRRLLTSRAEAEGIAAMSAAYAACMRRISELNAHLRGALA